MQVYLPGITPTFWKQVAELPVGLHNKENYQASAVAISQLFVAFVDRPAGTLLNLFMNGAKQATVKVVDETGVVYANIFLPHTKGQSTIEFQLKEISTGLIVASETFATSNIAFVFEIEGDVSREVIEGADQVGENISITGVEEGLLEDKFGVYTGLRRRNDQTLGEYRTQTSCLWTAFQYVATEKGLVDSLRCLLGNITITVVPSRLNIGNLIFDDPQYYDDDANIYTPNDAINLVRKDPDKPHYYIADIPSDFRTSYAATEDPLSIILLGVVAARPEADNNPEVWDNVSANKIQSFTIRTSEAIGNEVFIEIDEADAIKSIVDEQVNRRIGVLNDFLGNTYIASTVTVTEATINSTLETLPINLPVEGVDFDVNVLTGEIVWKGSWPTYKTPDDGTLYKVDYSYRLDEAIAIIVKQVKPMQRSVVILFTNQTSSLPKYIET